MAKYSEAGGLSALKELNTDHGSEVSDVCARALACACSPHTSSSAGGEDPLEEESATLEVPWLNTVLKCFQGTGGHFTANKARENTSFSHEREHQQEKNKTEPSM